MELVIDEFEYDVPFIPGPPAANTEAPVENPNPPAANTDLPIIFCVKTRHATRLGYYLMRWSHGGVDAEGKIIHILKPANHLDRYFNITASLRSLTWNTVVSRKNQGTLTRNMSWLYSGEKLVHEDITIDVLRISPIASLPAMKVNSFIPIQTPARPARVTAPLPPQIRYTMSSIPQHIIRALLRDAAMQEEECPITSCEIDVTNGAITSCFHLFEKTAINKWLSMPNSKDKCPVCNAPCNSYTLEDEVPPLDTTQ